MLLATAVSVSDGIRVGASLHLHVHPRLHLHLYLLVPAGLVKEAAAQRKVYEVARESIFRMTLKRSKSMSKDKLFSTANWDEAIAFVAPPTSLGKVEFKRTRVSFCSKDVPPNIAVFAIYRSPLLTNAPASFLDSFLLLSFLAPLLACLLASVLFLLRQ